MLEPIRLFLVLIFLTLLYQVLDVFKTTTASTAATPPSDVIPASGQDVVIWNGEVTSTTGTSIDVLLVTGAGELLAGLESSEFLAGFESSLLAILATHVFLLFFFLVLSCPQRILLCLHELLQFILYQPPTYQLGIL